MQLKERLQQCQKEHRDLSLMLRTVAQGTSTFPTVKLTSDILQMWHLLTFSLCLRPCADSRCRLCPDGWLWWRSRCYFFSVGLQEDRQWNESAEFCRKHNSSLAVIKDSAEMVTPRRRLWSSPTHRAVKWVEIRQGTRKIHVCRNSNNSHDIRVTESKSKSAPNCCFLLRNLSKVWWGSSLSFPSCGWDWRTPSRRVSGCGGTGRTSSTTCSKSRSLTLSSKKDRPTNNPISSTFVYLFVL